MAGYFPRLSLRLDRLFGIMIRCINRSHKYQIKILIQPCCRLHSSTDSRLHHALIQGSTWLHGIGVLVLSTRQTVAVHSAHSYRYGTWPGHCPLHGKLSWLNFAGIQYRNFYRCRHNPCWNRTKILVNFIQHFSFIKFTEITIIALFGTYQVL